ncbi:deoxyribonuclease IV [Marinicrinis sediminis]|uniref:Deoxyribonuclease IV n=1 Tax=Marinicrinis sediminis TaxID=1652465 RepID=A0ABW5RED6_9BACL
MNDQTASQRPCIGVHLGIRNGYYRAARRAHELGIPAFQYFSKNPRTLSHKEIPLRDTEACRSFCRQHGIQSVLHAPYPTNPCLSPGAEQDRMVRSILNDLQIAEANGSIGVVVHFGHFRGKDPLQGYQNSIQCLNRVLAQWDGQARILIENQAGQGTRMGMTLEECATVRSCVRDPARIGFCLDTCHLYAAGLWDGHNWAKLLEHGRKIGYIQHVQVLHLNDSLYPSGSFRDRHADIGQGEIGRKALGELLSSFQHVPVPVILETRASKQDDPRMEWHNAMSLAQRSDGRKDK